ncbi:hypothetical protein [Sphingorhabdus sp.]|uniref:hypothetical protein n=1 Tax=Sphingorhabdus sp. TaxID=1902408 RepID=UPI00391C4E01
MFRYWSLLIVAIFSQFSTPARAEVVATFYSHDFGDHFPHAFVKLKGTVGSTGEAVDTNFGFTAVNVSPAILMGSVKGVVETKDAKYIAASNPHFSVKLSDAEYHRFMAFVEKWRTLPGKSYNLGKRNCVHFAMEAAALLGLSVNRQSRYFKKPKTFLLEVMGLNKSLKP